MLASVEFDYCTMMTKRTVALFVALALLGACDKDPTPPKTPPAPQTPSVTQAPEPAAEPGEKNAAKPAPAKAVKPFEPLVKSQLKPLPEPAPSEPASTPVEPAAPTVRAPQPPDKIQRLQVAKPQTPAQKKASEAVKQAKVAKPKLDLHLPKDLVKKLEPQVSPAPGASAPVTNASETALLPQLFAEKPNEQSSFEMGGRVLTNEHSRDQDRDASYFDTVDGAELQFKFRH